MARPWAVDAVGGSVPTWFEADGSRLVRVVDARGAVSSVVFDPSYSTVSCQRYGGDFSAYTHLDMDTFDTASCPITGMFEAANGYLPVWGHEGNVANDYGKVLIRQGGECTGISDTGWAWDFQVPCKAHDYCYDLRKASFSGTVTDSDCDVMLWYLMEANCNDRNIIFRIDCRSFRDNIYSAVSLPWVVTDPTPGEVILVNEKTGKCADVEGPSTADNTPIQQWGCAGVSNQRFRIRPAPGAAGYFQVKPQHTTGKCARALVDPVQWSCQDTWNTQRFEFRSAVWGSVSLDEYTIRSKYHPTKCWKVPGSYSNGVDLDDSSCNSANDWYLWEIREAK